MYALEIHKDQEPAPPWGALLPVIDLSQKLADKDEYERRLDRLQDAMLRIQQAYLTQGRRAAIAVEGWDAAGKGGLIRRLTSKLDPRFFRVWPIKAPSDGEKAMPYLHRFWQRLPEPGVIAIFDRSWYGRVLVERVEGFASKDEWRRAYDEINGFEKMLVEDGIRVVKLFMHLSAREQKRRLRERIEDPRKHWKINLEDLRNFERRADYLPAIEDMFERTATPYAPWHLASAEHKWTGRIQGIEAIVRRLADGVDLTPPALPPALRRWKG